MEIDLNIKKVVIGETVYTIKQVDLIDNDYDLWGQIVYEKRIIFIKKSLDDIRKKQTIIHEIMHGVFFESGYSTEDNEDMVNRLSITISGIKTRR